MSRVLTCVLPTQARFLQTLFAVSEAWDEPHARAWSHDDEQNGEVFVGYLQCSITHVDALAHVTSTKPVENLQCQAISQVNPNEGVTPQVDDELSSPNNGQANQGDKKGDYPQDC